MWLDHAKLTRTFIINAAQGGVPGDKIAAALDANARTIANQLAAFYGEGAGSAFYDALRTHLGHLAEFVEAVKTGNDGRAREAGAALDGQAILMADFLASQDPSNFDRYEWRQLLRDHAAFTAREAAAVVAGDLAADERWWAAVRQNAEHIAAANFRAFWVSTPGSNRFYSPFGWQVLSTTFGEAARGRLGIYR
jgi:hypothetical protein